VQQDEHAKVVSFIASGQVKITRKVSLLPNRYYYEKNFEQGSSPCKLTQDEAKQMLRVEPL
jgi:hypothetical protein